MKITPSIKRIKKLSAKIKNDILYYSYVNKGAHINSCLSISDILTVLYGSIMNRGDRFILSKGHAAVALYCVLAEFGYLKKKLLRTYLRDGSLLTDHPEHLLPGILLSTGSLGLGLSVGAGFALAKKIDRKKGRVFVLISDAELNEGSTWEAVQFASHYNLDNLILIIDDNGLQAYGKTEEILNLQPFDSKFHAFNWEAVMIDGHNHHQIFQTLKPYIKNQTQPKVVIAKTIGGKGVSFMEGKFQWHYLNLTNKLHKKALKDLSL